ncbi:unnamed protein product [Thlaspi arvense]|uniref:Uncharacterized protein n=1 Tax=Thlaspi arvense TaxID=13288 RepID=A0AAU9RAV8_THLAR|nr:unnamed protein product [Thlaspi arvense]
MGTMFGSVEDCGEMFQDTIVQTGGASLSSTTQIGNPVVYKLVRVGRDGRLVPATDEELLEVEYLLRNNENDTSTVPDPGQTPDEGSPSQFLQLESLEGLYQSETAEVYTEKLNPRLESKEELMYGSQMLFTLPDTNYQSSNELPGNEELVQSEVLLQEPIRSSSNGCSMDQSMDASPYSNVTGSPEATAAPKPGFSRDSGKTCLNNLSIKALQETFRATFGRETTCKDKRWLKRRITMGLINSCVIPATSLEVNDNKLIGGGQNNNNDTIGAFCNDTVDEGRANNCNDTPSSPDCIKGHSNDFGDSPVEIFVDHYSGNEDFEGESAKRVRKPTRRYIEEVSEVDEKQQSNESLVPSKDDKSLSAVSSGGRVVVTRMVSLAGSRIQVPYVSHVRRSRPRENITALGEFHSSSWKVKGTPEESKLNLRLSQLNYDVNRVSGVKSVPGPGQKELAINHQSDKDFARPNLSEVAQDAMEAEHIDCSSGDSSDDDNDRVDRPVMRSVSRRKHHRAWTVSEVIKLVEGVSKYGVGKWSEIKRLSFSSFAYRTSVDLKDKWRNLLKASFSQNPSKRMGSLKKYGSTVIPSQVLLQVRELAQKQSLVSPANDGRRVKESRNGFL